MDKITIKTELERTAKLVESTAQSIPEAQWGAAPGPDRWSAAQILEHIIITEGLVVKVLPRKGRPCNDREPDARVANIRDIFNNDGLKLTAYGPIVPGPEPRAMSEQLAIFNQQRQEMLKITDHHDLTEKVRLVKHPKFGELTRGEWLWFYILHSERHARQMQRLLSELNPGDC